MTKVYVLMVEEDDSYDMGTHQEFFDVFTDKSTAELVIAGLTGMYRTPNSSRKYYTDDFEIQEVPLR